MVETGQLRSPCGQVLEARLSLCVPARNTVFSTPDGMIEIWVALEVIEERGGADVLPGLG